jgi:ferredoxin-thioredoxin reductase catalytic subunit
MDNYFMQEIGPSFFFTYLPGYTLNPNKDIVSAITKKFFAIQKETGHFYCPCQTPRTNNTICPCEDYLNGKGCHCNLYIEETWDAVRL